MIQKQSPATGKCGEARNLMLGQAVRSDLIEIPHDQQPATAADIIASRLVRRFGLSPVRARIAIELAGLGGRP